MSFSQQQEALFSLQFDPLLRQKFIDQGVAALSAYSLSQQELEDFARIKPQALKLDAEARVDLIMTQLCKQLPMSFAFFSVFTGGLEYLSELVNRDYMAAHPLQRAMLYVRLWSENLQKNLHADLAIEKHEIAFLFRLLECEYGLLSTKAKLLTAISENKFEAGHAGVQFDHLFEYPVNLGHYVNASRLPAAYATLCEVLCPCDGLQLWPYLKNNILHKSALEPLLVDNESRLLLVRAYCNNPDRADPQVEFKTLELSEAFANLLPYLSAGMSIGQILEQLMAAGAEQDLLDSVRAGFTEMLNQEMLTPL